MKNLYPKSKGKIYPSPSASSSPAASSSAAAAAAAAVSSTTHVLNLLPAAILALISVLGFDDREVLAYLILRSMKTPSLMLEEKKKCKKPTHAAHRPPLLDCPCFDCYTGFWIRWDSSPNRELIHQAIEAFEEHLAKGETPKKGRKKDRRLSNKDKRSPHHKLADFVEPDPAAGGEEEEEATAAAAAAAADNAYGATTTRDYGDDDGGEGDVVVSPVREPTEATPPDNVATVQPAPQLPVGNNRGLVRKVWPDVMGMFNSRLWGLWNPNV
ncbi:hypothetical protein H6P81_012080 [Aristolochia fimbriata]|uniref:Uncharacterized protein n=1 Tax=Aristolochia fimbriata TaxID=158543 RepID=A0AAV7EE16_ARIFI|nr:hypothetical protein H6P81_012080 [Aristolochia fimbriata]